MICCSIIPNKLLATQKFPVPGIYFSPVTKGLPAYFVPQSK